MMNLLMGRSKSVVATGPSGQPNQAFAEMESNESFHIAAETAKELLDKVGASWS